MVGSRGKLPTDLDIFEKTTTRVLRKISAEIADAPERVRVGQQDVERYIDEREHSIRAGARRSGKRFSL
jgi:hypothetical protein